MNEVFFCCMRSKAEHDRDSGRGLRGVDSSQGRGLARELFPQSPKLPHSGARLLRFAPRVATMTPTVTALSATTVAVTGIVPSAEGLLRPTGSQTEKPSYFPFHTSGSSSRYWRRSPMLPSSTRRLCTTSCSKESANATQSRLLPRGARNATTSMLHTWGSAMYTTCTCVPGGGRSIAVQ